MKSISKWISVISKALLAISFTFVMIHQITSYSSFASRSAVAFAKETKEPLVELSSYDLLDMKRAKSYSLQPILSVETEMDEKRFVSDLTYLPSVFPLVFEKQENLSLQEGEAYVTSDWVYLHGKTIEEVKGNTVSFQGRDITIKDVLSVRSELSEKKDYYEINHKEYFHQKHLLQASLFLGQKDFDAIFPDAYADWFVIELTSSYELERILSDNNMDVLGEVTTEYLRAILYISDLQEIKGFLLLPVAISVLALVLYIYAILKDFKEKEEKSLSKTFLFNAGAALFSFLFHLVYDLILKAALAIHILPLSLLWLSLFSLFAGLFFCLVDLIIWKIKHPSPYKGLPVKVKIHKEKKQITKKVA